MYLIPVEEAVERFKVEEHEFTSRTWTKWIDDSGVAGTQSYTTDHSNSQEESWVRVVELYDMLDDKLLVWSPDHKACATEYLFEGIKVQVGALEEGDDPEVEVVHERTGIPFKSASGQPIVPILPLYFSRDPDTPLRGYSMVQRSLHQFRELNVLRTYQAQGVRRMARQWIVRAGFFDPDAAAKLSQGIDGEFIEVDLQPGQPLEGNISPVPQAPIPADILAYSDRVMNDVNDAGMAPFTRGEVTNTTATEQNLLSTYTSSEISRLARIRDALITTVSLTYNVMLSVVLGDEAEPLALPNPVGPTILSADDLTGDFRYFAVDGGQTPMSDYFKQQSLERLAPVLVQLGADPTKILEEMVRVFQLPEDLAQAAPPPPAPEAAPSPEDAAVGVELPDAALGVNPSDPGMM